MSKEKTSKKKTVVKTKKTGSSKKKITPTSSRSRTNTTSVQKTELIFNKQNYMLMAGGVALILLGMLLMTGGGMENPDVWDDSVIYSFRRTVLAPFIILAGLILEIYAIFKK